MAAQRFIPKKIDVDTSPVHIDSDSAYFLKGIELGWQIVSGQASNSLEIKPSESNYLYCTLILPTGVNKVIGYYYHNESNEGYCVVYNSEGNHLIYRIRGVDGTAEIVYRFCKNFKGITNNPKDYFGENRIAIKSICRWAPGGQTKELFKALYLVNKKIDNLQIVIEDSIKTESFTTSFFNTTSNCCGDKCRIIKSGVPTPMGRIKVIPIEPTDTDRLKQNMMLNQMFQFRIVHENAWGQRSEHGIISDSYFNNISSCSRDSKAQPHCVWLVTKKPCPEIVKVTVEVRSCQLKNVAGTDGNLLSDWKEAYHFDLYDQSNPILRWYERVYDNSNKEFEFIDNGKNIRMKFCNNRECKPIALSDIRNKNPMPFNSGTVASLGSGLAYGDNENNFAPMSKEDISSVKYRLEPTTACEQKYSDIVVWAAIHNYDDNQNNPIFKTGNGDIWFGGFGVLKVGGSERVFESDTGENETSFTHNGGYGQTFPAGVEGFRGRLAGTNITAESKQYLWTPNDLTELDMLAFDDNLKQYMVPVMPNVRVLLQKFTFQKVPCGTYFFEINGHNDTVDLEKTSTYYRDTTTWNGYVKSGTILHNAQKRIFIDTSAGNDYDSMVDDKLAIIQDITYPGNNTFCVRGYIYSDPDNKEPIELADVYKTRDGGGQIGTTDHNGFYFWTTQYGEDYALQIKGANKCLFNQLLGQTPTKRNRGTSLAPPLYATTKFPSYDTDGCNKWVITGKIVECDTGSGIGGVPVILGRSKYVLTNSKGEFKVIAHYAIARGIEDLIVSLNGNCSILDCNCNPIKIVIPITQPQCTSCVEDVTDIGIFRMKTIVTKGFPHGSRIQMGLLGHDDIRMTDVQTIETAFIDFPTEQEQGNSTFPKLIATLPDKFSPDICSRFKYLTIVYSKNINYDDWITWAADEIEFTDSAGNKNSSSPTKIKIWWRSLNKYNLLRGLNTNTTWAFLNAQTDIKGDASLGVDGNPVFNSKTGDIVEFIQNPDGKYFPPNTVANIQYEKEGTYFIIDYDDSLKGLQDGVKFKIKRPYVCEISKTFYEYSVPINFCGADCTPRDDDGNQIKEIVVDGFSSYMLPRQIPVIKTVEIKAATATEKAVTEDVTNVRIYPYLYEHHSPSDTWGDHCHSGGRVSYINPKEGKKCDRNQILISGGINDASDGNVNYLHYFSLEDQYTIAEQSWGSIIAILVRDDQQVLVICEYTVFSFRTNDDRAVVDPITGYIKLPINRIFGSPERNPSFNFGCQLNDINTIRRKDSIVTWLDSNKQAVILHDFNNAVNISAGIQSWLTPSIKDIANNQNAKYWHSCFDHRLNKIFLTKFNLTTEKYVNNEIDLLPLLNETMGYDFATKEWRMAHFTPEYFGNMFMDKNDIQLFSFKNGLPYAHHNAVNPTGVYLNYFGEQCFPVIGVVTNLGGTEEKQFISTQVLCKEILFIIERLETSTGQKSRVYESHWERPSGTATAYYLCDTANDNPNNDQIQESIFDGDTLYGKYLKALYIPEPGYKGEWFLLTAIESFFETNKK